MLKSFLQHISVLLLGMVTCGFAAIFLGKELSWDLANYHYYIPFAFLHGRAAIDYWPTSFIHQFLNPTLDFLTYFLININTPFTVEFILGMLHGINVWLIFLIAQLFLKNQFVLPFILAMLGLYGPMSVVGIGSFQNDMLISNFVLLSIYLQIKSFQDFALTNKIKKKFLLLGGVVLGMGAGLKLTACLFAIGATASFCILPINWKNKVTILSFFACAFAFGMLLTAGYWMFLMWQAHGNPVFPFLNSLFHSADFALVNWRDLRFLPHNPWQAIFFPFYFSWDGRITDIPFRDFRFLIVYILFMIATIKFIFCKVCHVTMLKLDLGTFCLFSFFIFSYMIWEYYFSIGRYMLPLELLAPLIIFLLVHTIINNSYIRLTLLYTIFYFLVATLSVRPVARAPWFDATFFNVKLPQVVFTTANALVLTAYPAYVLHRDPLPQSYLIPYFPHDWRFVGIPFSRENYLIDDASTTHIKKIINQHHAAIYLLASDFIKPHIYNISAKYFDLLPAGKCEKIFSDRQAINNEDVLLCPLVKRHDASALQHSLFQESFQNANAKYLRKNLKTSPQHQK